MNIQDLLLIIAFAYLGLYSVIAIVSDGDVFRVLEEDKMLFPSLSGFVISVGIICWKFV